jgi:hypothetical protein
MFPAEDMRWDGRRHGRGVFRGQTACAGKGYPGLSLLSVERIQALFYPLLLHFSTKRRPACIILYFFVYINGGKVHNIFITVQKDVRGNGR